MFRKLFLLSSLLLSGTLLSGCSFKKPPAALQIKTKPVANVFIDGKLLGKTPYQASDLKAGEASIKLIPESDTQPLVSWEGKVKLNSGVLTLIERELGSSEGVSSGQILTLDKTKNKEASLSVVSDPDGALVKLDGDSKGFAPLTLDKVDEQDHEIVISKDGFTEKVVNAKAIAGYKLIVSVKLAQVEAELTPTPSLSLSPTPSPKGQVPKVTVRPGTSVTIKETPTGWLRVRSGPSTTATEVARVNPGETYSLLEEQSGWYKITYQEGKEGWISSTYATKTE